MRNRGLAAFACLAVVAAADLVLSRKRPPWILVGLFDEPAHLATAGVVLANLRPSSNEWAFGFIAGGALPDLDHVPLAVSRVHPNVDDPRPVTHCLLAVSPSFAAARLQAPGRPGTRWPAPRPGRSPTSLAISPSAPASSCSSRSAGAASRCPIRYTSAPWRRSPPAPLSPRRRASRPSAASSPWHWSGCAACRARPGGPF